MVREEVRPQGHRGSTGSQPSRFVLFWARSASTDLRSGATSRTGRPEPLADLVTPLGLKTGGNYCLMEPLGAPLLSRLVIRAGTKEGPATARISGNVDERPLVSAPKLKQD
jgi:hypothetical protein